MDFFFFWEGGVVASCMVHCLRPWGQKPCDSNYDKEVLVAYSMHKGKGYSGAEVGQ